MTLPTHARTYFYASTAHFILLVGYTFWYQFEFSFSMILTEADVWKDFYYAVLSLLPSTVFFILWGMWVWAKLRANNPIPRYFYWGFGITSALLILVILVWIDYSPPMFPSIDV